MRDLLNKFCLIRFDFVFSFIWIFEADIVALENYDSNRTTRLTKLYVLSNDFKNLKF